MIVNPAVVGSPSHQVLHLVTVFHRHLLGAIALVGIDIFHAEIVFTARIIRRLVGEETLVLAPHPIVEEVLLAVLRDDDFQFGGVAAGKNAVAAEDEVLRTERLCGLAAGIEAQVEALHAGAAGKCRVGDGYRHGHALLGGAALCLVEAYFFQRPVPGKYVLAERHGAGVVVDTSIDVDLPDVGIGLADVLVIHHILRWRIDHVQTYTGQGCCMDIRQVVGYQTATELVAVVIAALHTCGNETCAET